MMTSDLRIIVGGRQPLPMPALPLMPTQSYGYAGAMAQISQSLLEDGATTLPLTVGRGDDEQAAAFTVHQPAAVMPRTQDRETDRLKTKTHKTKR